MASSFEYFISDDKALLDIDVIHSALSSSYWSPEIPQDIVERALHNSYCVGAYTHEHKSQIGFARLVTDYATFAYLADVFVLDDYKGHGVGKALMEFVMGQDQLKNLRRWLLATKDAHGLYAQYGFEPIPNPEIMMQIAEPDVYQRLKAERAERNVG